MCRRHQCRGRWEWHPGALSCSGTFSWDFKGSQLRFRGSKRHTMGLLGGLNGLKLQSSYNGQRLSSPVGAQHHDGIGQLLSNPVLSG